MKVKRASQEYIYEVVDESRDWWLVKYPLTLMSEKYQADPPLPLRKSECAIIVEEQWEDITAMCEECDPTSPSSNGYGLRFPNYNTLMPPEYRLVKNRLWRDGEAGFKIERRKS